MKGFLLLALIGFISPMTPYAQEIEITNVKLNSDNVEIFYNLLDERIDRSYTVNLYTSKDNFIQPMELVSGDVGVDIPVGNNKKLIWKAGEELGDRYDGGISLELKGNYYVPFITVDGLQEGKEFKRSASHDFIWAGGRGDNILNFELYKGDNLIKSFEERPNTGSTELSFPRNLPPGDDYQLRISDAKNRDEVVFTNNFTVKRKYPLALQIGGFLVIGTGLAYLINALIPEEEFEIAGPPLPSNEQ